MDDAPNARRAEKRGAKKLSAGYPRAALSFLPSKPRGAELGVKPPGSCRTRALSHGHLGRTRTVASRSPLTRATRRAAMSYILEVPGLADAIARAHVLPEHAALLAAIRSYTPFADAKLPTSHDGYWLSKRKVLNAAGKLVHDDHEAWLQPECERAGGDVRATQAQLKNLDYRLTECEMRSPRCSWSMTLAVSAPTTSCHSSCIRKTRSLTGGCSIPARGASQTTSTTCGARVGYGSLRLAGSGRALLLWGG